jgi:site-specific recombinase XerD
LIEATRATAKTLIKKRTTLTVEELRTIDFPMTIQGDSILIENGLRGFKLRKQVKVNLQKVLNARERGLVAYILKALVSESPALISFVFNNQSLIKMARYFLRHCSGSLHSCYTYTSAVKKYSEWLECSPDIIIKDVKPHGAIPDPARVQKHIGFLNDFLASLQDAGLKPGAVYNCIKNVRTFYRVNGVKIELSDPISRRVTYKDRAPKPEELEKLLNIASLRASFMVSGLALGGFREDTFSKLLYRHVKEDLEKNKVPIHIHVEAEITKGKYHDYDTFLGAEAAQYLKLYIELRRKGTAKIPPENIADNSPLIRDARSNKPKSVGAKQIRKIVHGLYVKADLVKKTQGRMYDLRTHSLRKYFKTQMMALGVQPDYIDYMMGHTVDTYDDIQSLGIDMLRNIYRSAGLAIRPKTKVGKIDTLKEIIRAMGLNPENILAKDALIEGATTYKNEEAYQKHQLTVLRQQLKELIHGEIV